MVNSAQQLSGMDGTTDSTPNHIIKSNYGVRIQFQLAFALDVYKENGIVTKLNLLGSRQLTIKISPIGISQSINAVNEFQ